MNSDPPRCLLPAGAKAGGGDRTAEDNAAVADGRTLLLLPHYRPHPEGLATVGGRIDRLDPPDRRLADFCRAERTPAELASVVGGDATRLKRLVDGGFLVYLPALRHDANGVGGGVDLVLSPHVDDAALSLGAPIAGTRDRRTLVLNVFSRQSYQTGLRAPRESLDELAAAEDALVGRKLGYDRQSFGFEGAQDRHGLPLAKLFGWTESAIRAEATLLADVDLVTAAVRSSVEDAERRDLRLFVPATIGGHLDHVLVALAASRLLEEGSVPPSRLHFYEDLPYAAAGMPGGIERAAFVPEVEDVTDTMSEKLSALAIFKTRLRAPQIALCARHAAAIGAGGGAGERRFVCRSRAPSPWTSSGA